MLVFQETLDALFIDTAAMFGIRNQVGLVGLPTNSIDLQTAIIQGHY